MSDCLCNASIFEKKDGVYIESPSCYLISGSVSRISKKTTTVGGVSTVVFIDAFGVEAETLPIGAMEIDCSNVSYIGNLQSGSSGGDCSCSEGFDNLNQVLTDIKTLVQSLPKEKAPINTGQPVVRLTEGTYSKAEILGVLNIAGYNEFVDTSVIYASYGLNSVTFVPSASFILSVSDAAPLSIDYTTSMEARNDAYVLEELDNFTVTVPAGEALDVHMVVWMTGRIVP